MANAGQIARPGLPAPHESAWQCVAEVSQVEKVTVRVHLRCPVSGAGTAAWSAFTIAHADAVEIYVFAEEDARAESEASNACASAACLDARAC